MAILIISLETLLLSLLDRKIYGTWYTPTVFLACPYCLVLFLYILFSKNFGFYSLYSPSVYIWCVGLLIYWFIGYLFAVLVLKKNVVREFPFYQDVRFEKWIFILCFILAVFININIIYASKFIAPIGSDYFKDYIGTGVVAHIAIFLRFTILYIIMVKNIPSRIYIYMKWFIVLTVFFQAIVYTTKGALIILIMSVVLNCKIYSNAKIKIRYILVALISSLFIFFISYSIVFGEAAPLDFIYNHTYFYFVSSIASLSNYCMNDYQIGIAPEVLFMPIINLYNKLMGLPLEKVYSDLWTDVGPGLQSNVKTFFGTIYIYGGLWGGILTIIIYSLVAHVLLIFSLYRNYFFYFAYCLCLSALALGWFDLFFNMIAFYEYIVFAILISILFSIKKHV